MRSTGRGDSRRSGRVGFGLERRARHRHGDVRLGIALLSSSDQGRVGGVAGHSVGATGAERAMLVEQGLNADDEVAAPPTGKRRHRRRRAAVPGASSPSAAES
ncbi:MAG: hypothetical protein R2710_12445 [Acidimicrobiales bacterium]